MSLHSDVVDVMLPLLQLSYKCGYLNEDKRLILLRCRTRADEVTDRRVGPTSPKSDRSRNRKELISTTSVGLDETETDTDAVKSLFSCQ